jgi:hypothetical protein
MRTNTFLLSALLLITGSLNAQTVATFDDLVLTHPDTFYVNYTAPGSDVGFNDGLAHFPSVYDTGYGDTTWCYFAYSNRTDSVTSGVENQYSAKTATGFGGSANYAVISCFNPVTYANSVIVNLTGAAINHPVSGFYVTNNTYAYNSMRDGDMFSRKFHNGDWFKLNVQGYSGGVLKPDSVTIYLADFLFPDTTMNYILKTWQWVNLGSLGNVDSLQFSLSSTDNSTFGMNTPAYFCMDNFTTDETAGAGALHIANELPLPVAKIYPNPAGNVLYAEILQNSVQLVSITDLSGRIIASWPVTQTRLELNTPDLAPGTYLLQLSGNGKTAGLRFVKQD